MTAPVPEPVWPLAAELGEGPVWLPRDHALWFVDIKKRHVHRFDPATGDKRSWAAPAPVGFALPVAGGGFVAGLAGGLHRFDPDHGTFAPLLAVEPDRPGNRLNDATVDRSGRLWFGTMDDSHVDPTGALYRLDADGIARPATDRCPITNGPAVSVDGRTLYHVDTVAGVIHAFDLEADGALANRRTFATIDPADGNPDGVSIDSEDHVWVGLFGGWSARRYAPDGRLAQTVRFPVANVTKIAFGGDDLKTAFATTARQDLDAAGLAAQPLAGALFAFRVPVAGQPVPDIRLG